MNTCTMRTPIGMLELVQHGGAIVRITACKSGALSPPPTDPVLVAASEQLAHYFEGRLKEFNLPIDPDGSPFQRRLWAALREIPYGETRAYGQLAAQISSVARAVGQACGANPILIVIPCHRVLAAHGRIGGFSFPDGTNSKRRLLALEARHAGLFADLACALPGELPAAEPPR
ncbi:MAG: methylated-DNA--[protein]-cysteine S-methyltransferase [Alphaproteobacteria bacterium]